VSGWSGGMGWLVCECVGVARQLDACDGLLQREQGQRQCVNWHAIFDMRSGRLTSGYRFDISFIGYRLTSLMWTCVCHAFGTMTHRYKDSWMTLKGHYAVCFKICASWCCYLFSWSVSLGVTLIRPPIPAAAACTDTCRSWFWSWNFRSWL